MGNHLDKMVSAMEEQLSAEAGVEEGVGEGEAGNSIWEPTWTRWFSAMERLSAKAGVEDGVGDGETMNSGAESADLVLLPRSSEVY